MKAFEVLEKMQQVLMENKWVKGAFKLSNQSTGEVSYCMIGAKNEALHQLAVSAFGISESVDKALARGLPHYDGDCSDYERIMEYNDADHRKFSDVMNRIERAKLWCKERDL